MSNSSDGENFSDATLVLSIEAPPVEVPQKVAMKRVAIAGTIKRLVAAEVGITLQDMTSKSRAVRVAHPRQLAMYLIRIFSDYSYPKIGRMFGRDHTTAIWAVARVEARLRADGKLVALMDRLKAKIEQETGLTPESVEIIRSMGEKLARLHVRVYCDVPGAAGITN